MTDADLTSGGDASPVVAALPDLTAVRRTLGLILLVLLTMGLYFAKEVILPLLMGTLLALTLSPAVRAMQRPGLGHCRCFDGSSLPCLRQGDLRQRGVDEHTWQFSECGRSCNGTGPVGQGCTFPQRVWRNVRQSDMLYYIIKSVSWHFSFT